MDIILSENRKLFGGRVKSPAAGQHLVVPKPHLHPLFDLSLTETYLCGMGGIVMDKRGEATRS